MQDAPTKTAETKRGSRLEARVSAAQKALFQRAAQLSGRTVSEFVVASAWEAATKLIQAQEQIVLSRAEQAAFVQALLEPPAPSARLHRAAKTYKAAVGRP